jgi:hypothetical protein
VKLLDNQIKELLKEILEELKKLNESADIYKASTLSNIKLENEITYQNLLKASQKLLQE